jgi:hypothetical protein
MLSLTTIPVTIIAKKIESIEKFESSCPVYRKIQYYSEKIMPSFMNCSNIMRSIQVCFSCWARGKVRPAAST